MSYRVENLYAIAYYEDSNHKCLHKIDGPAWRDFHGNERWLCHGKLHRLDGPAWVNAVHGYYEWWIDGKQIKCKTQREFEKLIKLKAFW